jgi:hypothetical protein
MAPYAAHTAIAARKQVRRPANRIVPAVPFALSRASRSEKKSTPEEAPTETVTQPAAEPQPVVAEEKEEEKAEEQPSDTVQAAPTSDLEATGTDVAHVEVPTPTSSQADSHDGALEKSLTQGLSHARSSCVQHSLTWQLLDYSEETHKDDAAEEASSLLSGEPSATNGEQSSATSLAATPAVTPAAPSVLTELPPPFYPAEKSHPQTASTEDTEAPIQPSSADFPPHHVHPAVEGLVFGGDVQGSPAVPSTPYEVESNVIASQQPFTRAPPGFAPPPFAAPFYPGHTHHQSNTAPAPWMYQQYPMVPPDSLHNHRQDFSAPSYQAGQVAYQASYEGQFPPSHAPHHMLNGGARSHSQSPNKSHLGGTKPDFEEELRTATQQNGNNSHAIDAKLEDTPFELAAYISSQFGNPEFADFVLQLRSEDTSFLTIPIHGIVVARSPVIAQAIHSAMMSQYRTKDSRRLVDIMTQDKFVDTASLNEALKVLYGAPLLSVEQFTYGLRPFHPDGEQGPTYNEARKRMRQVINYAAAGRALQIHSVQARGNEMIKALLRWDTIDQAIHFGLEGRVTRGSPASRQNGNASDPSYPGNPDTYGIAPLHDVIEFMAYNFPVPFSLYTLAPELQSDPRLPSVVEFRSATHNPRLSRIRFGDAPPEDDLKPDYIARLLSSVLVSLPLLFLQRLFSHRATANQLGWTGVVKVMRDVVDEREKRRQKTLKSKLRPQQDGTIPQLLLENLFWEERVEPSQDYASGFKISEVRLADHV